MSKLLLIDGSGILVSNYYGTLPSEAFSEVGYDKIPKIGNWYTNAIFPTAKQVFDIIIKSGVSHVGIAFDKGRNTFRKEIDTNYKADRKETPSPLSQQFATCEYIFKKLGIFVISNELFEADDLIGSIAKQNSFCFDKTYVLTKDKDYIQLVDSFITVWMSMYKKEVAEEKLKEFGLTKDFGFTDYLPDKVFPFTPDTVLKDKGILPQYFNQVLALAGDKTDNIKGVRGISEETALKLIKEYNTIEEIFEEIEHANFSKSGKELKEYWKEHLNIKRSPFNALIEYEEDAKTSLKLATIKTDIEFNNFNIDNLKIPDSVFSFKKIYETSDFYNFRDSLYATLKNFLSGLE